MAYEQMTRDQAAIDHMDFQRRSAAAGEARLCDYRTGDVVRVATVGEWERSVAAAEQDSGRGVIEVDGRSCYVEI